MIENQMTVNVHWEKVTCAECKGTGKREIWSDNAEKYVIIPCDNCDGDGEIEVQR
jgi:DnaJ-class molecular chaperone